MVMTFMKTKKVGEMIHLCGTPFLALHGTTQTVVELERPISVAQEALNPAEPFPVDSFRRRPSFHTLLNAFDKSIKVAMVFFLS